MLKPVDILVLLGLLRHPAGDWTVRSLGEQLFLPPASVQRALERLGATPKFDARQRRVSLVACSELLEHALRFVAPTAIGSETRGMLTAWAAPPLSDRLAATDVLPPVWPDPSGEQRGLEVEPLHPAVVLLARADKEMYESLTLIDAIRVGDTRSRSMATELLRERIQSSPAALAA